MRQNKASRFNRNMMVMMIFMGIIVIACVYIFLYMSLPQETVPQDGAVGETADTVTLLLVDSIIDIN